jgi:hypothetical protein
MKNATGKQSTKQIEFEQFVTAEGYLYAVFNNWRPAFHALCWYLDIDTRTAPQEWARTAP